MHNLRRFFLIVGWVLSVLLFAGWQAAFAVDQNQSGHQDPEAKQAAAQKEQALTKEQATSNKVLLQPNREPITTTLNTAVKNGYQVPMPALPKQNPRLGPTTHSQASAKKGELIAAKDPVIAAQLAINSQIQNIDRRTTAFTPDIAWLAKLLTPNPYTMTNIMTHTKWIRVDLSEQLVVAYEGKQPVRAFVVSSGLPGYETITGKFRIITKVPTQSMFGGTGGTAYNLDNVQWVQYFFDDFGFHGTYWHNEFGSPRSHGCLNMTNADAKWLFDWTTPQWDGSFWQYFTPDIETTTVVVHE